MILLYTIWAVSYTHLDVYKRQSVVSVEDEIRNLEAYFSIMKARYRQRLCYSIVCEKETVGYSLPKLTLQPLAENAIKYSLAEIEEVVIKISVQMRKETLCLSLIHI